MRLKHGLVLARCLRVLQHLVDTCPNVPQQRERQHRAGLQQQLVAAKATTQHRTSSLGLRIRCSVCSRTSQAGLQARVALLSSPCACTFVGCLGDVAVHATHHLKTLEVVVYCCNCAAWAKRQCRSLSKPGAGVPSCQNGKYLLRRFMKGLKPLHANEVLWACCLAMHGFGWYHLCG